MAKNKQNSDQLAQEAAPHVETALRAKLESAEPGHLKGVSPAQIAEISGKIVNALPGLLTILGGAGLPLPSSAVEAAKMAVEVYALFGKHFPGIV